MAYKNIHSGNTARKKVIDGIIKISDVVSSTLGPKGKLVAIKRVAQPPIITKDGVTVAREVMLKDPDENVGAIMVYDAANRTMRDAGDGTTATTLIAKTLCEEGNKALLAGAGCHGLISGIQKACEIVVQHIKDTTLPYEGHLEHVATIAANGDAKIGKLITEAYEKVGKNGLVLMGEPLSNVPEVRYEEGMKTDCKIMKFEFVNQGRLVREMINPLILIFDGRINQPEELLTDKKDKEALLKRISKVGRPVLLLCNGIDDITMTNLIQLSQERVNVCAAFLPGVGDAKKELAQDIAAITGATVLSSHEGHRLPETEMSHLGECAKVIVGRDSTIFYTKSEAKKTIDARVKELQSQLDEDYPQGNEKVEFARGIIQERIARLSGGIATIHVGGYSDAEIREKADRIDDAIRATRSAMLEGVVIGGGMCLRSALSSWGDGPLDGDEYKGFEIFEKAIRAPFEKIITNADEDVEWIEYAEHDNWLMRVLGFPGKERIVFDFNIGYNAATGAIEDLIKAGILDSAGVVRCSVQNATSVACLVLAMDHMLVEQIEAH
jgi:chaperonin GroEL